MSVELEDQDVVFAEMPWLRHLRVRGLELRGILPADEPLEEVVGGIGLESLLFTFTTPDDEERSGARSRMFGSGSGFPLARVRSGRVLEARGSSPRYSMALSLAEAWDLESNHDAEERLREYLRAHGPELEQRVVWDSEADAVWARADERSDLHAIAAIARDMDPTG